LSTWKKYRFVIPKKKAKKPNILEMKRQKKQLVKIEDHQRLIVVSRGGAAGRRKEKGAKKFHNHKNFHKLHSGKVGEETSLGYIGSPPPCQACAGEEGRGGPRKKNQATLLSERHLLKPGAGLFLPRSTQPTGENAMKEVPTSTIKSAAVGLKGRGGITRRTKTTTVKTGAPGSHKPDCLNPRIQPTLLGILRRRGEGVTCRTKECAMRIASFFLPGPTGAARRTIKSPISI